MVSAYDDPLLWEGHSSIVSELTWLLLGQMRKCTGDDISYSLRAYVIARVLVDMGQVNTTNEVSRTRSVIPDTAHVQEREGLAHLLLNAQLDGEDRALEAQERVAACSAHARLPAIGDALLEEHRVQVLHAPATDRQQRRGTAHCQQGRGARRGGTYLEAPNILWIIAWLYWPFVRLDSARRLLSMRETSPFVSVPSGPEALSRSSSIRRAEGFDWSALWYVSSPERTCQPS